MSQLYVLTVTLGGCLVLGLAPMVMACLELCACRWTPGLARLPAWLLWLMDRGTLRAAVVRVLSCAVPWAVFGGAVRQMRALAGRLWSAGTLGDRVSLLAVSVLVLLVLVALVLESLWVLRHLWERLGRHLLGPRRYRAWWCATASRCPLRALDALSSAPAWLRRHVRRADLGPLLRAHDRRIRQGALMLLARLPR